MKRSSLIFLILSAPLAIIAQTTVFTDTFGSSTLNGTSTPGGVPSASSTSYDIAATKAATTGPTIGAGKLRISLNAATTSGFVEAQALFTGTPVSLVTVGDYINLTYTFTNTGGTLLAGGTASYIYNGLYNSGGQPPVAGALSNGGLTAAQGSTYATNNCQLWQGYVSRISSGGTSEAYTRPMQTVATNITSANQDLVGSGVGGGAYVAPTGTVLGGTETAAISLTSGGTYTISCTIALTAAGTLTITNNLFNGVGTGGTLVFSQTNSATGTNNITSSFDGLALGLRNSGTSFDPTMDISSITITKSIAGSPGPSFNVTGGGLSCAGDTVTVSLDGSVSTNTYYLYTNGVFNGSVAVGTGSAISFPAETVLSVPLTNTVVASNTVSGFTGLMSGSVLVAPYPAPTINSEPGPVVTATNNEALFVVGASGQSLHYQWYRNGGGLSDGGDVAGSGTSTLVISPAQTADAAGTAQGYYCVITNDCGTATISTTDGLTLDAPANIVWQGGNPNANWDLSTTANFTNRAGSPVVFHGGDDVTLDDSSSDPVISIVGTYIAPTLLTEQAVQNYAITGSGTISGSAALIMNGSGVLTVSNVNTFTGGTTINAGIVKPQNYGGLGSGVITLAGGTLEIPTTGSATLGLTNSLNVTANGTLQFDLSGTYAAVIYGAINGSPGSTLNFYNYNNNPGSTSRFRLYGGFTNDANISLSTLGTTVEIAPYQPVGTNQVYNGVISGNGHFILRGRGEVVFNNANTMSDGTYSVILSGEDVGLGIDSVYSTPPAIQSGPVGVNDLAIDATAGNSGIIAEGGPRTLGNGIYYLPVATNDTGAFYLSGSNNITLAGNFQLTEPTDAYGTNRTIDVDNTAASTIAGVVSDGGLGSGLIKSGGGALYLNGTNTYSGPTTNTAGLLAGTGSIAGSVDVQTNSSIGGGSATAIGTLTISNNLTLEGNVFIRINKALSPGQSNDVISVVNGGTIAASEAGTVTVTNIGAANLVVGDRFQIFNQLVAGGSSLTVTGAVGVVWKNNLGTDGSISVQSIASAASANDFLTSLVLSPAGALVPSFMTNGYAYSSTNYLPNNPVTVTVVNADTTATNVLYFNSVSQGILASGTASGSLNLSEGGNNQIQVVVTAQNGTSVNTYNVNARLLPSQTRPTLTRSVSGTTLGLSWPSDHLGYRLLVQTNNLQRGISTNLNDWSTVAGSTSVTSTNLTIVPSNFDEFYRLVYP